MILNIYKPLGFTSFDVVAKVRKISGIKKVGHAGTLDPLAEGVLLLLTDADTKKQDSLMHLPKKYYFEFCLNVSTPSFDLESLPKTDNSICHDSLNVIPDQNKINEIIDMFTGESLQEVPLYSAKKMKGKRLYKIARKLENNPNGTDIETIILPKNRINIYEMNYHGSELMELETDVGIKILPCLKFSVYCSSGTYVRSLVRDIALALKTVGVVTKLIRTAVGMYKIEESTRIEDLKF